MKKEFIGRYPYFEKALLAGRMTLHELNVGGKNQRNIEEEVDRKMKITDTARKLLKSEDFKASENSKKVKLVELSISDLGLTGSSLSYKEIIWKATRIMGLMDCPHYVVGCSAYDLQGTLGMQPIGIKNWIGTTDEYIFSSWQEHSGGRLILDAGGTGINVQYSSSCRFIFAW